jgi:hypothetical protein
VPQPTAPPRAPIKMNDKLKDVRVRVPRAVVTTVMNPLVFVDYKLLEKGPGL